LLGNGKENGSAAARWGRGLGSRLHRTFVLGLGALSWGAITTVTALSGWPIAEGDGLGWAAFFLFLSFCFAARLLAFEVIRGMAISLDSALYIAAIWILGPLGAAWVATFVLSIDGVRRVLSKRAVTGPEGRGVQLLSMLAGAGTIAAEILVVGSVFPIEGLQAQVLSLPHASHVWLVATIPLLTLLFLATNYGIGGFSLWLKGHRARDVAYRLVRYGVLAECLQIPVSMAVVEVFDPASPFNFVLLGITFLVINAGFKQIIERGANLRRRVQELTALNQLGRAMIATLRPDELARRVADTALDLVPSASHVAIGVRDEASANLLVRTFEGRGLEAREAVLPSSNGLAARVLAYRTPRHLADLSRDRPQGDRALAPWEAPARSWLGVPLSVYDDAIGYLAVQSEEPNAFGESELRVLEAIAQQAAAAFDNARLYALATVDGLTQLYVRRYFDQRLAEEWRRSARYGHGFAIVLLDLDDFKALNDAHGHLAGDVALREVAGIVRRAVRNIDLAARFGGEEFAILLPRASAEEAARVASRIRADIEAASIETEGATLRLTASFGVSAHPDVGAPDVETLLRAADEALYEAKGRGKNRVCARPPISEERLLRVV
jgi:diguanylate cyclase (GGDEF)-like protein